MKIKCKPRAKNINGFWSRRFKGNNKITINNGTYSRHFANNEFYSLAMEALSRATFAGPLDMRQYLGKLQNGFEELRYKDVIEKYEDFSRPVFDASFQTGDFVDS